MTTITSSKFKPAYGIKRLLTGGYESQKHIVNGKRRLDKRHGYDIMLWFGYDWKVPAKENTKFYKRLATKVHKYLAANIDKIVADCQ